MTHEELQELKEKAELWDSLSDSLRTIFCGKFDRPNGTSTIENISNSSSHIGLLEEESKEMLGDASKIKWECITCGSEPFGHFMLCQKCLDKSHSGNGNF